MSELHAFAAAVRLGNFSLAAAELCVTQSAISRAVTRLEQHYGCKLLDRNAHSLRLTAAGAELLEAVRDPLATIEGVSVRLRTGRSDEPLSLAVVPTLASVWLIPRLRQFQELHPQVRFNFVPYRKGEDFSAQTPDAAILTGLGPEEWPQCSCDYVIGREMVPICHPARLAQRRSSGAWMEPGDLAHEPLLYHTTAPGNWAQWLREVGAGDRDPNLSTAFDQVSMLIQAAIADMGVALVQRCLIREEARSGAVAIPFDVPVTLQRGYFLCTPQHRRPKPGFAAFRRWLLRVAADDIGLMANQAEPRSPRRVGEPTFGPSRQ
ncbi:LysR family transcriptional regulator [Pseudorhodoferax aquiterrae]|nr:LysR family transcriptional regulator [Pseudorhodoferax aquiterrae]